MTAMLTMTMTMKGMRKMTAKAKATLTELLAVIDVLGVDFPLYHTATLRETLLRAIRQLAEPEDAAALRGRPEAAVTGVPVSILPPAVDASERRQTQNATKEPLEGEIVGPVAVSVPPATPQGDADAMGYVYDNSNSKGCPHCDGTGTCPRGFPLPIRCSLCHHEALDCCPQLTEEKRHDR